MRSFRHTLFQEDREGAEHPDAFEAADLLSYPENQWWRKVNPPDLPELGARPSPPTRALYWRNRSPERLTRSTPLPGESKLAARDRAKAARSYFARVAQYDYRVRVSRVSEGAEWRVVLIGYVAHVPGAQQPPEKITEGRQASPWQDIGAGAVVNSLDIRSRYLETARRAVALSAPHAPKWDEKLGTFTAKKGYIDSDRGIVFPSPEPGKKNNKAGIFLEVRRV